VFSGDFPECNKISNVSILFQELKAWTNYLMWLQNKSYIWKIRLMC
jgi:hypothetical protein